MKKILFLLPLLAVATATAQVKIATIRMAECFAGFYETELVNESMDSLRRSIDADLREREAALRADAEPFNERAMEIRDNPGLTDEAKRTQLQALNNEMGSLRQREQELVALAEEKREEFVRRNTTARQALIDKITNVAREIAIRDGYDLLLDTSDIMGSGTPTVVYSTQSIDITSRVITELNRNRAAAVPAAP